MNNTRKTPQKSSIPYSATGLSDRKITSPIETRISRIKVNFGSLSQNKPIFTAQIVLYPVQKSDFSGGVE